MAYRTRRCQPTASIADDDCPFDEIAKKVEVEPKQKSQSLCRPRSTGFWQPAAARQTVRGHHAGLISRSRTAGNQLTKKNEIVPKTTFYTPIYRRATATKTTTSRSYDTSTLLARGGDPCIDIDNKNDKEVEENPEDDDSSSFSDDASTDSDATSFGTSVSSLTRKFSDLQQHQSMHLRMSEDTEVEDKTNASFSYFQASKEDTTFLRDTIGSTGTNDDDSMDTDSLNDNIDNQQQEDDGYTSFRMKQASRLSQKCHMICFVDDSDSVGLEDFLEADSSRQKRPKRHGRRQRRQQQQKVEQDKTNTKTTLSYFCESLDCLGAFNGVFWKNESSSSSMDATVPIGDFESQAI